jgi:hypothetical protein
MSLRCELKFVNGNQCTNKCKLEQVICPLSNLCGSGSTMYWLVCSATLPLSDYGRVARQNEAARAADAAREAN